MNVNLFPPWSLLIIREMFSTGHIDNIPFNILKIFVWTIYYFQTPCWTPSFSLKIIKFKKKQWQQ